MKRKSKEKHSLLNLTFLQFAVDFLRLLLSQVKQKGTMKLHNLKGLLETPCVYGMAGHRRTFHLAALLTEVSHSVQVEQMSANKFGKRLDIYANGFLGGPYERTFL
ncbi:Uncharacterised protein r2_g2383 [Pycnogonum litorale]